MNKVNQALIVQKKLIIITKLRIKSYEQIQHEKATANIFLCARNSLECFIFIKLFHSHNKSMG